jgi:gas vesicle protein
MNQESSSSSVNSLLLTFIAGAAVGAVVVALTTRKTGPQLRGDLKDLARRAKLRVGSMVEDASEAYEGLRDRTVMAAKDLKRGMNDAANDLRG